MINNRSHHSSKRNYFSPSSSGNKSVDIELEEGKYYWTEAHIINGGWDGHFALSVEAPENSDALITSNTVTELTSYTIVPEKQNEIY